VACCVAKPPAPSAGDSLTSLTQDVLRKRQTVVNRLLLPWCVLSYYECGLCAVHCSSLLLLVDTRFKNSCFFCPLALRKGYVICLLMPPAGVRYTGGVRFLNRV
jgi:hypothetical protein